MDRDEAEGLLQQMGETVCVRFYQRPDGTVMTSDCPIGVRRKRRRLFVLSAVGGTMLAGAAAVATTMRMREIEEPRVLMGAAPIPTQIAPPPEPEPFEIPESIPPTPPTTTAPVPSVLPNPPVPPNPPKLMGVPHWTQGLRAPPPAPTTTATTSGLQHIVGRMPLPPRPPKRDAI
jgi:hypothetical protein